MSDIPTVQATLEAVKELQEHLAQIRAEMERDRAARAAQTARHIEEIANRKDERN